MKIFVAAAFLVVSVMGMGYTQELPVEVKRILENYVNDSTAEFGPLDAKKWRYLSDTVQLKDIGVGRVLQEYRFKRTDLNAHPNTVPFSELIIPNGSWRILIMAHDKPAYELILGNSIGELVFIEMSSLPPDGGSLWEPLLRVYPESKGINPVLFRSGREKYLYFGQKGPRKIYYVRPGFQDDPLETALSGSIETLDDSRRLLEYWRKKGVNEVGIDIHEAIRRNQGKPIRYGRDIESGGEN